MSGIFGATGQEFVAFAVANLDDDPDLDVWSIDNRKQLVHVAAD